MSIKTIVFNCNECNKKTVCKFKNTVKDIAEKIKDITTDIDILDIITINIDCKEIDKLKSYKTKKFCRHKPKQPKYVTDHIKIKEFL